MRVQGAGHYGEVCKHTGKCVAGGVFVVAALFVVIVSSSLAENNDHPAATMDSTNSVTSSRMQQLISSVIGLRDRSDKVLLSEPVLLKASASSTPELPEALFGVDVWKVETGPVMLDLNNWKDVDARRKRFTIFCDSSGSVPFCVIGVCSDCSENDSVAYWSQLSFARLQQALTGKYRVPIERPRVPFMEALDGLDLGGPNQATVVIGLYLKSYLCWGDSAGPAWVIETSGFPAVGIGSEGAAYRAWSNVIDATTGELIFSASAPCSKILAR